MKYKNLMDNNEPKEKSKKKESFKNKSKESFKNKSKESFKNKNTFLETFDVMNSLPSDYPPVNNLMEQFENKHNHVKKVRMILILVIVALLMSYYVIKTF